MEGKEHHQEGLKSEEELQNEDGLQEHDEIYSKDGNKNVNEEKNEDGLKNDRLQNVDVLENEHEVINEDVLKNESKHEDDNKYLQPQEGNFQLQERDPRYYENNLQPNERDHYEAIPYSSDHQMDIIDTSEPLNHQYQKSEGYGQEMEYEDYESDMNMEDQKYESDMNMADQKYEQNMNMEIIEDDNNTNYEEDDESREDTLEDEAQILTDISKLWNKRDYYYKIDQSSASKIIKNFEAKISNPNLQVEDAFYSNHKFIPVNEITLLREDPYIKERLECRKIREMNYKFLEISSKNFKEIEEDIQMYKTCTDEDNKLIIKSIIKQKKRLDVLYNTVRNYLADLIIKGEECYIFMDSVWSAVFRKSLELATTELSSQECN